MPAAACSTNVGGMAAHWTCACPRPGNAERIPFIAETDYEHAFSKAEQLLCVTQTAFTETPEGEAIRRILGSIFDSALSHDRRVQPMPLACSATEDGRQYWVGPDVILGPLADPGFAGHFALRADTLCRRLYTEGSRVTGALLEYLPTGAKETVHADVVIVACDALRTPQLLWASDIRPRALGHYLNEHPFIFCAVELDRRLVERWATTGHLTPSPGLPAVARSAHVGLPKPDPVTGVFWVPFDAPGHPFHGQIMHLDVSPLQIRTPHDSRHIVGLGWGCLKEVRYEDCIEFSGTEADFAGMPAMRLRYRLTERDRMEIDQAKVEQRKAAAAFGRHIQEGGQTLMPAGTSLHMQGTVRMGAGEDGTSVCDSYSRVWGYDNLFVGGNGVIPTATTSNPTLTSVAMAVRASERVVAILE
jgi:pyranose oxidase